MEQTYYCYLHTDRISQIVCTACGKRLCNSCARFSFGKNLCDSCFTAERTKAARTYSDPLRYSARKVQKKDYTGLTLKYITRFMLLLIVAGIVIFKSEVYAFLKETLPAGIKEQLESTLNSGKNIFALDEKLEKLKETTGKIAGSLATKEMNGFVGQIGLHYKETGQNPLDFSGYVRRNFESKDKSKDVAKDLWGTEYRFEGNNEGFSIISAGVDREFGTGDDVVVKHIRKH